MFVFIEIYGAWQVYLDRPITSSSSGMRDALLDLQYTYTRVQPLFRPYKYILQTRICKYVLDNHVYVSMQLRMCKYVLQSRICKYIHGAWQVYLDRQITSSSSGMRDALLGPYTFWTNTYI